MEIRPDFYTTWVNAKVVAWAWIGALLFPFANAMPLNNPMFWVCAGAGLLVFASMTDGLRALRRKRRSEFIVKTLVPSLLLLASVLFNRLTI